MAKKNEMETISVRVPISDANQMAIRATVEGRTFAGQVRLAIKEHLQKGKK
jgi:hypothetical protein